MCECVCLQNETVFAGFNSSGHATGGKLLLDHMPVYSLNCPTPTVGRLCELVEGSGAVTSRTSCQPLNHYLGLLEENSNCSQGEPGVVTWTPDQNTPDIVYYQVHGIRV